jgi:hypothetical protein
VRASDGRPGLSALFELLEGGDGGGGSGRGRAGEGVDALGPRKSVRSVFDAERPTVFVMEGLLEYLPPALHRDLLLILRSAVAPPPPLPPPPPPPPSPPPPCLSSGVRVHQDTDARVGGSRGPTRKNLVILQNLEPAFGASFNREGKLPYERLVSSSQQTRVLEAAGFEGVRVYDDEYFAREYGRATNAGFVMMTARC